VRAVYIEKISKQNLEWIKNNSRENLKEGIWSLKIVEHKYIIKIFIRKFGM
jgi:hypothetical protein